MRHFIKIRFLLLLLMAIGIATNSYAQKCGNFETTLTITDSPCQSNGAILVKVSGPDVTPGDNGEPAALNNLQYCAVVSGVTPKETDWRRVCLRVLTMCMYVEHVCMTIIN